MKYNYKFTETAKNDLSAVLDYIATKLCNIKAANNILQKIENSIEQIRTFPYAQSDCKEYLIEDNLIRKIIIDNYVLVYQINEDEKLIIILRFRYAQMDLTKLKL